MTVSLKSEILEHLSLKKGAKNASSNISSATKDFAKSSAPQFRGKSQKKRHQMAVAAGLAAARGESTQPKVGEKVFYEGKQVLIQSINETTGMAVVKLPRMRDPKIVRLVDLKPTQALTESFIGMAPIGGTWREQTTSQFIRADLSPDDIGLEIIGLREDDQEEPTDNGSNVRSDGHTGKKEVDELPTPSDTIAPAYSDEKAPKIISKPLSTEPGYTVATDPDLDGYDYPADAPEIPHPEFDGAENGNPRAPHWSDLAEPGKNQDKRDPDEFTDEDDAKRTDEAFEDDDYGDEGPGKGRWVPKHFQKKKPAPEKMRMGRDGKSKERPDTQFEAFDFIAEMDDLLGPGEDREPGKGDTITVTLPAMASIVCTVANKCGGNPDLLKSMIEALDEVGHGKTIDIDDLQAVASHMNGEETQEVMNRDAGQPDHAGMDQGGDDHESHGAPSEWPGDGEKSHGGKTKLMGGMSESEDEEEVEECGDEDMMESSNYYGWNDMVADSRKPTEEEEFRDFKRRAGLKFW